MVITRQGHIVWSSYVEAIGRIGRKKPQVVAITLKWGAAALRHYQDGWATWVAALKCD